MASVTQTSGPKLERFIASIVASGRPLARYQMAQSMGAEALRLVKVGFERGVDPYGRSWPAPVLREGQPLLDTGRLRNAFQVRTSDRGVEIVNPTKYANIQNYGGVINAKNAPNLVFRGSGGEWFSKKSVTIPARRMVPEQGDLPALWRERLTAIANTVMRRLVGASAA